MENRVYYGEYSLQHWIRLILKKDIILPDYQRYFVWNQKKVETLIDTLKNKQFVPPVTIGAFNIDDTNQNLILDGQQRLTSLILAYLGLYPDEKTYKSAVEKFANDNDTEVEEEELQFDNILEWDISSLTKKGRNKKDILDNIVAGNYKDIDLDVDEEFFKKTFLGFSYLVPQVSDKKLQLKYYSSVFRNINIQGEPLLPQESRAALYFLDQDLVQLFAPEFFKHIVIKIVSNITKADFVRFLSLLSHYKKDGNANRVARSYKPKMEKYYEEYIYATINNIDSATYGKFSNIFPDKKYDTRLSNLNKSIELLGIPKVYPSIIDLDMYFFGLIFYIVFNNKIIDSTKKDELKQKIENKINVLKKDYSHKRSPNNLGHLRFRITESIKIYGKYITK